MVELTQVKAGLYQAKGCYVDDDGNPTGGPDIIRVERVESCGSTAWAVVWKGEGGEVEHFVDRLEDARAFVRVNFIQV